MKYCVLIIDGASGWPLDDYQRKTCLELARTPNLDSMANSGLVGLARNVPEGMEASSACACMSLLGYDPRVYYTGRGPIEAKSMGIHLDEGEVAFRCNLVAIQDGTMWSYSSGHISSSESHAIIVSLQEALGSDKIRFHPGVSYRHICTIKGGKDSLAATCTPPHDIPDKPISEFLPYGPGSDMLVELMERSKAVLSEHPVNIKRRSEGKIPATMVWLFWGGERVPDLPPFQAKFGLKAAMTSGVDLLRGLARMIGMTVLDISGVTDDLNNDYSAQVKGALLALEKHDMAVIHIEAPDEAGHGGNIEEKVEAIEQIDENVVAQLLSWQEDGLRVLALPDHSTPIELRTHVPDPVPFVLWGPGLGSNRSGTFSEKSAEKTALIIEQGHDLMEMLKGV